MSAQVAYQQYKQIQVKTANRGKLLLMLYQGCIRFLKLAEKSMAEKKIEDSNKYLLRAQDIISELQNTLDRERGGQIARDLNSLYDFMNSQLIEANIQKDIEKVQVVEGLMTELLETWKQIINGPLKARKTPQAVIDEPV